MRTSRLTLNGAEDLLAKVASDEHVPVKVRRDVLTYRLMAAVRRGARPQLRGAPTPEALYEQASKLDPDSPTVTKYEIMHQLTRMPDTLPSTPTPGVAPTLAALESLIAEMSRRNAADDPLVAETRSFLQSLNPQQGAPAQAPSLAPPAD